MAASRRAGATALAAFDQPIPSPEERLAAGKALRTATPRSAHGGWEPAADRRDPIDVLVESNSTRDQQLVPLRYARMAVSPFTFLRGSALGMAYDLATTPSSGIDVRLCGDAHIANFGMFASPERRLMFDLNDFDETWPGPFEWDLKRLAASIVVAARDKGLDRVAGRRAVLEAVASYRDWMERFAAMTHLEVWYAGLDTSEIIGLLDPTQQRRAERRVEKIHAKSHRQALDKLTLVDGGRRMIVPDPPIIERFDGPELQERLETVLGGYRTSLPADRQELFDRYRFVDFARKVVGVGSVGTRCWIALFQGPNGGPLFLQLKEARAAAPQLALGSRSKIHNGRRVVEGQRALQSTSDILLGWGTDPTTDIHYYVRQMWDAKGSVDIAALAPRAFGTYTSFCGWALARAHARTGDSVTLSGYIGRSERFAESLADFAEAYADQTERDHALLVAAIERGSLPVA